MDVAVITAVRPETRAALAALAGVRRVRDVPCPAWEGMAGRNRVTIVQGGVGFAGARRAATLIPRSAGAIVSFGFAGALRADLTPGTLVVCDAVVWDDHGTSRRYDVARTLVDVLVTTLASDVEARHARGTVLSSPVILASSEAKGAAARRYDALAVEMEAAALAIDALARGVPLLPVRAILDPLELSLEGLPAGVDSSWVARARLAARPSVWPMLLALRRHLGASTATLTRTGARLLPALSSTPS